MKAYQIAGITLAAIMTMGIGTMAMGEEVTQKSPQNVTEEVGAKEQAEVKDTVPKTEETINQEQKISEDEKVPENLTDKKLLEEFEQVSKKNEEQYTDTVENVDKTVTAEDYIPVLMYHHFVTDEDLPAGNGAIVKINEFEEQIKTYLDAGYTMISLEELDDILLEAIQEKAKTNSNDPRLHLDKKYMVITIDDGYRSNYELAYPILKKYNVKADISVITSRIHTSYVIAKEIDKLSWSDLNEMQESGLVHIYSHTYDHVPATEKTYTSFRESVQMGEKNLDDKLKERSRIKVLTYPNGLYNQMSQVLLRSMGFDLQLTTESYVVNKNTLVNRVPRITVNSGMTGEQVLERIQAAADRTFQ